MAGNDQSQDQNYVQNVLHSQGYKSPGNKALANYLASVSELYTEFHYIPQGNGYLTDYFRAHPGASRHVIDLETSINNLPVHQPAVRAAAAAAKKAHNRIFGRAEELNAEWEQKSEKFKDIEQVVSALHMLSTTHNLGALSSANIMEGLIASFEELKPEAAKAVKEEYIKSGFELPPSIKAAIDPAHKKPPTPEIPKDYVQERHFRNAAINLTIMAFHELMFGKLSGNGGLFKEIEEAKTKYDEEKKRLPQGEALMVAGRQIRDEELKPAVARHILQDLHGMVAGGVKPDNLCLAEGSSIKLLEAAVQAFAGEPQKRSVFKKAGKKKLLMFAMSWDGMKVMASESPMEANLIPGSVNAHMLEEHIKHHILKDKYANNLEKARAEVKKQVGALVMNIPENPSGKSPSEAEMRQLAAVIQKYDLPAVISDELYAQPNHKSLLTYPGMDKHCYLISSTSKNMKTKKLAFGYSDNPELAKKVIDAMGASAEFEPGPAAGFAALIQETPLTYYQGNHRQFKLKRNLISHTMREVNRELGVKNGVSWLHEPDSGCLGVITVSKDITDACGIKNSCELSEYIYKFSGIRTDSIGDVEGSHSGPIGVRINFSKEDDVLVESIQRIGVAVKAMQHAKENHVSYDEVKGDKYRGEPVGASEMSSSMMQAIARMFGGNANVIIMDEEGNRYGHD